MNFVCVTEDFSGKKSRKPSKMEPTLTTKSDTYARFSRRAEDKTMEFSGLTDSPASILNKPPKCANCSGTSRLGNGLCLKCLLHYALVDEQSTPQSGTRFIDTLDEVGVSAANWVIANYEILDEVGRGGM